MKLFTTWLFAMALAITPVTVTANETIWTEPYVPTSEIPLYFIGDHFVIDDETFSKDEFCTEEDWLRAAAVSSGAGAIIGGAVSMMSSVWVQVNGAWVPKWLGWAVFRTPYLFGVAVPFIIGGAIIYGVILYFPSLMTTCLVSSYLRGRGRDNPFQ